MERSTLLDLGGTEVLELDARLPAQLLDEPVPSGRALAVPLAEVGTVLGRARADVAGVVTTAVAALVAAAVLVDIGRGRERQQEHRRRRISTRPESATRLTRRRYVTEHGLHTNVAFTEPST